MALLLGIAGPAVRGESPATGGRWTQKQFIITFWCPPPATDEALARVAAEGFNLTWTPPEGLDAAARHHLRAMLLSAGADGHGQGDDSGTEIAGA